MSPPTVRKIVCKLGKSWFEYPADVSDMLKSEYASGKEEVKFSMSVDGVDPRYALQKYTIHFPSLTQKNVYSGKSRKLKLLFDGETVEGEDKFMLMKGKLEKLAESGYMTEEEPANPKQLGRDSSSETLVPREDDWRKCLAKMKYRWVVYPQDVQELLKREYMLGKDEVEFKMSVDGVDPKHAVQKYKVNFDALTQTNVYSKTSREIKLVKNGESVDGEDKMEVMKGRLIEKTATNRSVDVVSLSDKENVTGSVQSMMSAQTGISMQQSTMTLRMTVQNLTPREDDWRKCLAKMKYLWVVYPQDVQELLKREYMLGKDEVEFRMSVDGVDPKHAVQKYKVNFDALTQTNVYSKTSREIKLVKHAESVDGEDKMEVMKGRLIEKTATNRSVDVVSLSDQGMFAENVTPSRTSLQSMTTVQSMMTARSDTTVQSQTISEIPTNVAVENLTRGDDWRKCITKMKTRWMVYPEDVQDMLKQEYSLGKDEVNFEMHFGGMKHPIQKYKVDFVALQQTNLFSQTSREIKLIKHGETVDGEDKMEVMKARLIDPSSPASSRSVFTRARQYETSPVTSRSVYTSPRQKVTKSFTGAVVASRPVESIVTPMFGARLGDKALGASLPIPQPSLSHSGSIVPAAHFMSYPAGRSFTRSRNVVDLSANLMNESKHMIFVENDARDQYLKELEDRMKARELAESNRALAYFEWDAHTAPQYKMVYTSKAASEGLRLLMLHCNIRFMERVDKKMADRDIKVNGGAVCTHIESQEVMRDTCSFMRYLGLTNGFYPTEFFEQTEVDGTLVQLAELYSNSKHDEVAYRKTLMEMELQISRSGGVGIFGEKLTIADFELAAHLRSLSAESSDLIRENIPHCLKLTEFVYQNDNVREYMLYAPLDIRPTTLNARE